MKNSEITRNESFYQVNTKKRKQVVYDAIKEVGPITNREIAAYLKQPINRITGRVNELVEDNKVEEAGKKYDKETNRTVMTWQIVKQMKLFDK